MFHYMNNPFLASKGLVDIINKVIAYSNAYVSRILNSRDRLGKLSARFPRSSACTGGLEPTVHSPNVNSHERPLS